MSPAEIVPIPKVQHVIAGPGYITIRLQPPARPVIGAGTSAVIPAGVLDASLPKTAILVSPLEFRTGL